MDHNTRALSGGSLPERVLRTILITGATSGIGLEAARQLAAQGHEVIVHGRTAEKAEAARAEIGRQRGKVAAVHADLSRLGDLHALARRIADEVPGLDTLVHNAGVYNPRRRETVDGFEETFAVNHLAPFVLTHLLLPVLERNAPARTVVVASRAHHNAELDLDDPQMERRSYVGWLQYCNTKLMNILFTRALARRLDPQKTTVNALHPGFVATRLARGTSLFNAGFRFFGISPEKGAKTTAYLAASPEVAARTGLYWVKQRVVEPSEAARDQAAAERLWGVSVAATGLADPSIPRPQSTT